MANVTNNPDGTTSTTIDLVSDRGKLDAIADVLEGCRRYAETAHRAVSQRFHSGGDIEAERERFSRFAGETAALCLIARKLADGSKPAPDTANIIARCIDTPGMIADALADPCADITGTADRIGGYMLYGSWDGASNPD